MTEEYENILKQLDDLPRKLNIEIRAIMFSNICLKEENKKYKEVIDKAIKFIEDNTVEIVVNNRFDALTDIDSLLDILKEVE